ncbi:MAG: TIGR03118 family protein [Acidobacteria bacterium]|nr:TIGR03118 family protein [Acidobacteriota bacterium]
MLHYRSLPRHAREAVSLLLVLMLVCLTLPGIPASASTTLRRRAIATTTQEPQIPVIAPGSAYRQTNFVSDIPGAALIQDPLLVNPWGITLTASSPFWVVNNGTGTSTLYRGDVAGSPLVKNPGLAGIVIPGALPTGVVANTSNDFFVNDGSCCGASGPSRFIFDSITGNILGWNPNVPTAGSTVATKAMGLPGHVYTGLAIGNNASGHFIYAADFNNGKIDVFSGSGFTPTALAGNFADPTIPTTAGNTYHPYNIQNLGGSLYVTYAKVGVDGRDEEGIGNGFVRRFNTDGVRDLTFGINNGPLNSPWGLTIAPASFGIFGGALLVGNFGEGNPSIHAFNPTTGAFLGTLQNEAGDGIEIDELWALTFGNGGAGGDPNTLYFTAGIAEEEHGLFGSLKATTASATSLVQFSTDEYAIGEGSGHIDITVTRSGDASGSATVNVATFDESQAGHASQKSDYEISLGTLKFNPGETSKTFRILIVDDKFVEGNETIDLMLSNPTGAGVGLGSPNTAEVKIIENDSSPSSTNPIDDSTFFVRQHYLDFLNREPDAAGLAFWVNQIESCGADAQCRAVRRINVSAAFFLSIEFRQTGLLAYLTEKAAYGARPLYGQFERDVQALQKDFVFGAPGADAVLEANKQAFFNEFVTRPEFVSKFNGLTNDQYVDALLATAGIDPANQRLFVATITNAQENPPTNPTASGGGARPASFGTAKFQFNAAQTAMTFTATINNIDVGGTQTPGDTNDNLVNAHIHASATVTPTTNAPVVWGFFGSPFNDNNPNDQKVTPFTSGVGGTFSGKWDAPEGNGTTLAAQLSNLRQGRAYINFHTVQFPGGEIRGNFPSETAFRDSLVAGLNGSTMTRAEVLRKVAESEEFSNKEFNAAFVLMEYFGYLRRDADTAGFNFWLNKLNAFNGDFIAAEMVKAFISSSEYRQRFGPS